MGATYQIKCEVKNVEGVFYSGLIHTIDSSDTSYDIAALLYKYSLLAPLPLDVTTTAISTDISK